MSRSKTAKFNRVDSIFCSNLILFWKNPRRKQIKKFSATVTWWNKQSCNFQCMHIDLTLPLIFRDDGATFQERLNLRTRQIPRLAISKLPWLLHRDAETARGRWSRRENVKTRRWSEHLEVFLVDVMERTCDLADGSRAWRWKAVVHRGMTSKKQKNRRGGSGRRVEEEKHGSYHDTSRRGCARYARAQPTRVCTHDTVKLPRQKQLRYSPTVRVTRPWDNEDNQTTTTTTTTTITISHRASQPSSSLTKCLSRSSTGIRLPRDKLPSCPWINSHNRPLAFSPSSSARPHVVHRVHLTNFENY